MRSPSSDASSIRQSGLTTRRSGFARSLTRTRRRETCDAVRSQPHPCGVVVNRNSNPGKLPTLLLRFMPAGKVVPAFDRRWLALVLTVQVFVGASFGIAAQLV